ncbi:MAG: hypothetical protein E7632_07025 [Ruminococcaceae bacterium]|nr:hypothetical protein [Oscillospiraceae bacterium]
MAKYTIEELYRGEKYSILSAVGAKAIRSGIDPHTADGRTWLEMELIRQTFITAEKMKQNGDCIAEGELGDAVTVSVSEGDYLDRAIAQLKKYGVPEGEDMLGWFGKLIVSEQISDRLGTAKEAEHEHP